MREFLVSALCFALALCLTGVASACSLLYVGGAFTDDGASLFARTEDGDFNDENKLYLVTPAGTFKAGDEHRGCYGFTWTFTHDNYRYISRRDDNLKYPCPICGSSHPHHPYEEAGTNEYGLTLTATQSVDAREEITGVDPYLEEGLGELEMATILLSECATPREAVELLKETVEKYGLRQEGFGVMLCNQEEQWYCETVASHYFLAIRLPRDVAFFQANACMLGMIDLDDENIICSDGIIDLAQKAGTFIGDAEKNIIDYRRSLSDYQVNLLGELWHWNVATRTSLELNAMEKTDRWNLENVMDNNDFIMTNIGEDGSIVSLRNNLKLSGTVDLDRVLELLRIYPIGYSENVESHIYRFYPDAESDLGVVEWSALDNNQYNIFVPGYPILMTDTWKGYQASLPKARLVSEDAQKWNSLPEFNEFPVEQGGKPDTKDAYECRGRFFLLYLIEDFTGIWHILPEGWEESYDACFSAMSNYLTYSGPGEEAVALAKGRLSNMQQDFVERFEKLTARLQAEKDPKVRQEIMTAEHAAMSEEAQTLALSLYRHFVYGEELPEAAASAGE